MAMSRDGLLPRAFSAIHPRYKTPYISTLIAGLLVAIPSLFMNLSEVTDLNSIGTLFAFLLVCAGSLKLNTGSESATDTVQKKFKVPYFNSQYVFPVFVGLAFSGILFFKPGEIRQFFNADSGVASKLPMVVFCLGMLLLAYVSFKKKLSLIPVLGLCSCGYLITELGITTWIRFGGWLVIGFFCYFLYGRKQSRLNPNSPRFFPSRINLK